MITCHLILENEIFGCITIIKLRIHLFVNTEITDPNTEHSGRKPIEGHIGVNKTRKMDQDGNINNQKAFFRNTFPINGKDEHA